ncbi:hypothetical protein Aduo_011823 [Ancylostoma duodenale]
MPQPPTQVQRLRHNCLYHVQRHTTIAYAKFTVKCPLPTSTYFELYTINDDVIHFGKWEPECLGKHGFRDLSADLLEAYHSCVYLKRACCDTTQHIRVLISALWGFSTYGCVLYIHSFYPVLINHYKKPQSH